MTDALFLSNSLADLAARIKAEHEATAIAMRRGVEHAMAAGDLLLEAKAQLKHGEWLPWLAAHCHIPERTARLYMRLALNRAELDHQIGNVADLTVRGAVALLASPRRNIPDGADDNSKEFDDQENGDGDGDEENTIADPAVIEDSIMYGLRRAAENFRAYHKVAKASALDREAAERINTAIERMIQKLRSLQTVLAKKGPAS